MPFITWDLKGASHFLKLDNIIAYLHKTDTRTGRALLCPGDKRIWNVISDVTK